VNNICGPFSPLKDESSKLKAGDIAKIDLGTHIDGYIAQAGHTIVVGGGKANGIYDYHVQRDNLTPSLLPTMPSKLPLDSAKQATPTIKSQKPSLRQLKASIATP
jgi:methionine aminopeptidase